MGKVSSNHADPNEPSKWQCHLYTDKADNWFARVVEFDGSIYFTSTYSTPNEAVIEATNRDLNRSQLARR